MADPELLAETNRLLRTILENDAEQRAKSEEMMKDLKVKREGREARQKEKMQERLRARGLPDEATQGTEEEWDARRQEAQRKSNESFDEARQRHERYQDDLLAELRLQSDLLQRIEERLA